jgi:hypothetical protein
MSNRPSKIKINVSKIAKEHLFKNDKGTYLDCAIWPNRAGADQRGNTHYITQEISKEARERGEKGAIIGNLKWEEAPKPAAAATARPKPPSDPDSDPAPDDVPF